jgi:16S rRNA (guanine966-N2)-methyltransferase
LFAGTGAVGIEALSRGAEFVRFTDRDRGAIETIRSNVDHCGFGEKAEVRRGDAFTLLAAQSDRLFDYVYIAPPQYEGLWSRALNLLDANPGWLSDASWVIAQIHPREYEMLQLKNIEEFEQRKYGSTLLVFYEGKPAETEA